MIHYHCTLYIHILTMRLSPLPAGVINNLVLTQWDQVLPNAVVITKSLSDSELSDSLSSYNTIPVIWLVTTTCHLLCINKLTYLATYWNSTRLCYMPIIRYDAYLIHFLMTYFKIVACLQRSAALLAFPSFCLVSNSFLTREAMESTTTSFMLRASTNCLSLFSLQWI